MQISLLRLKIGLSFAGILDFRDIRIGIFPDFEELFVMLYGFARPAPLLQDPL